jgi:hypothetical protein
MKTIIGDTQYKFCTLCGLMEVEPVSEGEYCETCNSIRINHPEIFRHILAIHEYSWDSGMHEAARLGS